MIDYGWPYNEQPWVTPNEQPVSNPWMWNFTIPTPEPDEVVITRASNGWSVEYSTNNLIVFTEYHDMVRWLSERYGQLPEDDEKA